MTRPKIRVSRLRDIGWRHWDPIGLKDDDGTPWEGAEDEYDGHLLQVAGMLVNGRSTNAAAEFLIDIAADHMGLGFADRTAAVTTVEHIGNYLVELGFKGSS